MNLYEFNLQGINQNNESPENLLGFKTFGELFGTPFSTPA